MNSMDMPVLKRLRIVSTVTRRSAIVGIPAANRGSMTMGTPLPSGNQREARSASKSRALNVSMTSPGSVHCSEGCSKASRLPPPGLSFSNSARTRPPKAARRANANGWSVHMRCAAKSCAARIRSNRTFFCLKCLATAISTRVRKETNCPAPSPLRTGGLSPSASNHRLTVTG